MKRFFLLLLSVAGAGGLQAQLSEFETDAFVNLIHQHTKKAIIKLVTVDRKDSAVFWTLYDEYQEKRTHMEKSRIQLHEKTALSYEKMSAAIADSLAHRYFENRVAQEKNLQVYYEKMKKATNAVTAFEFYQAEVFFQARVRMNLKEVKAIFACYSQ